MNIDTCAEDIDLDAFGIEHARCIDDRLVSALLGCAMDLGKDKNQRPACGCAESIDIDGHIYFTADRKVAPGEFVPVRATGVMDGELTGERV